MGLAALLGVLSTSFVLTDGDTLWHIKAGEWILAHWAIPRSDPFSYTAAGRPWVAHEWLAEVLLALAYRAGGWSGVIALASVAAGTTAGLLAAHLRRLLPLPAVLLLLIVAAGCAGGSLLARPHLLALPCLELWCAALVFARARGGAPPWRVLPVMAVWANLHGGFMLGLALAAALGVEAMAEAGRRWRRGLWDWGVFLAGAVLAALLTPHGFEGLAFPFRLLSMETLKNIAEWQPANVGGPTPLAITILLGLYLGLTGQIHLPRFRALLLAGLVFAALQHQRHIMVLGVAGTLLMAGVPRVFGTEPQSAPPRVNAPAAAALALLAALAIAVRIAVPFQRPDAAFYPASALAQVPAGLRVQPVLNDYGFGGLLIFDGIRPFIDGRADMYGDRVLDAYLRLGHPDPALLDDLLQRYGIAWTMFRPDSTLLFLLDSRPGWHRLYADRFAVIHVRNDALKPQ